MRTYDKLIATIQTGQGNGGLRSSLGAVTASSGVVTETIACRMRHAGAASQAIP
ncbi:hypothetical protein RR42_s3478 [Cupriavidus basilensis]|uniref:Uncharacterized protein n=1 Tax=Cupriavidus basilensis TaxID=68895 RepID=A0A0C4YSZ7_9BURK|nr:hypothetical protein RR42_s3478 [Cupriavidus basilensis]